MENDISYYFEKYQTDKRVNGYSNVYNDVFTPQRDRGINLLEIGIGTLNPTHSNMRFWKDIHPSYLPGASLRAFKEYFPNGCIYGVDIQPDCMVNEERIRCFLLDSTNKIKCDEAFYGTLFDFIIDDGDHNYLSQIKTFENFFGKLKYGGTYILEDLESPDKLMEYFNTLPYQHELRDRVIIIKK